MILSKLHKFIVFSLLIGFVFAGNVISQDNNSEEVEIPEPKKITLQTNDKVNLVCNFFGGTNKKESVPILLLHDLAGKKEEFTPFALYLQKSFGHAVLVPDLRGHGESTKKVTNEVIDVSKFNKNEFALLFNEDISTCFRYLRDEVNNEGECNIDLLCVISTGYISINAMAWTIKDYSYAPIGGKKQGQFVKAVVFLSPRKSIKGFSANSFLKDPLFSGKGVTPMPVLVAIGDDVDKSYREGKSILRTLEKSRPSYDDIADARERFQKKSLWMGDYKNVSGAALLDPKKKTKLEVIIGRFIEYKIESKSDESPWVSYKKEE